MVDKPERLAGRLRELREALNWTREVLAERSGVSASAIRDFEASRSLPGWAAVLALADALGVDVAEFTQEPAPRDPPKKGRPKQVPLEPPATGETPAKRRGRPRKAPPGALPYAEQPESEPETPAESVPKKPRKKGGA